MTIDFRSRWDELKVDGVAAATPSPSYSFYRPLVQAADEYVHWAQSANDRVYTGVEALDREMRGIGKGELTLLNGFSHSGKTLVLMQMLRHNRNKRVIYYCPDEPWTLTLIKLACVTHGIKGRELERAVANGDQNAIQILRDVANNDYANLAVFDQTLNLSEMEKAFHETCDVWSEAPHLVVIDYLDLVTGGGEDIPSKANAVKAWGKRHDVPLLVLHQSSRTAGADGKAMTISSGAYGGEQQATHIIGVRRKLFDVQAQIREMEEKLDRNAASERVMDRLESLRYEEQVHKFTITVNLVKNKRVDSDRVPDLDYEIEMGTGRIFPLNNGDLPKQYLAAQRSNSNDQF